MLGDSEAYKITFCCKCSGVRVVSVAIGISHSLIMVMFYSLQFFIFLCYVYSPSISFPIRDVPVILSWFFSPFFSIPPQHPLYVNLLVLMGLQASLVTVLGFSQSLHTGWGDFFVVQAVGTVDCASVYMGQHIELNVVFDNGIYR